MKVSPFNAAEFSALYCRVLLDLQPVQTFVPQFMRIPRTKVRTFRVSQGTKVIPGFVPSPINNRSRQIRLYN
jgi:hypothetical protein